MSGPTWSERRLDITRAFVPEMGVTVRRLRPAAGTPARATLVYVHGLGESGLGFEPLVAEPALADLDHLVPDLPGYGLSQWTDAPLDLAEHAAVVDRFLKSLEGTTVGPTILVGHSMGGVIGLLLAEELAERGELSRLGGFLNIEGNVTLDDCGYSGRVAPQELDDFLADGWTNLVDLILEHQHEGGGRLDESGEWIERTHVARSYAASIHLGDPRTYWRNSKDLVAISGREVIARRLAVLAGQGLPLLYLSGEHSTGPKSLGQLRDAGVDSMVVPDAGHWPFLDHPQRTAAEVARFVERCGAP